MGKNKSSRVHPPYKTKYRVGNWREYEAGLRARGDITVWFTPKAIASWTPPNNGRRGAQRRYSDLAIEASMTLRLLFHLPLRQTEGFVASLFRLMDLDLPAPDHSTLSRRGADPAVPVHAQRASGPLHLIVDSTGLAVVGQGQWAAAKHGGKGIRGWRKLHIGVDAKGVIVAESLTASGTEDFEEVPELLDQVTSQVDRFTADAINGTWGVYEDLTKGGATVVIPPQKTDVVSGGDSPAVIARDATVGRVREVGLRQWKKESGYHQQGRAENTFFRYKRIFGGHLRARGPQAQAVEVRLACKVLNRMLELGAPRSYAIGR